MAKTYDVNEEFIRYQEEIASSPVYEGMPDLRNEDGSIQWEAPSNRGGGIHKDTHDKRLQWWKERAIKEGISPTENQWISKTAKRIHPTKLKPCKFCGRVMDIRYCYLSNRLIQRIQKLPYVDDNLELTETTSVFELIPAMVDQYGERVYSDLPILFVCKSYPNAPKVGNSVDEWVHWLETEYIPSEPALLGPGAMSNAPDRLDGFHSFNRCCRSTADSGRSKSNLASYSTDRRAFEYWSDGNWITANKLMGAINSNPDLMSRECLNFGDGGNHPRPCSADHIGPISLGFSHRPAFQLLCKPCNSAKNNRLYYSDVKKLIEAEKTGEKVVTWYAESIWNRLKNRVSSTSDALKLYRIMRDNRFNALCALGDLLDKKQYFLLYSLLNLQYAEYTYTLQAYSVHNHIVTAEFTSVPSALKYVYIQKARKIRVAFSALRDYSEKENRNGMRIDLPDYDKRISKIEMLMSKVHEEYQSDFTFISKVLSDVDATEEQLTKVIQKMPDLDMKPEVIESKQILSTIMSDVAAKLAALWDDDRYSREIIDE